MSLSQAEIDTFFAECRPDTNGLVQQSKIDELCATFLHETTEPIKEIKSDSINLSVDGRFVAEASLRSYDQQQFNEMVHAWNIPAPLDPSNDLEVKAKQYESALPLGRRLRAHWSVEGPQFTFIMLVISLQTAVGVWQLANQLRDRELLDLLGWGLVVAKASAGVLYPTLALMILSCSRRLGTWLRRSEILSKCINWDLSQAFHIQMAITAFLFTGIHIVGHLGGTFVQISRSDPRQEAIIQRRFRLSRSGYVDVMRSLPAITGMLSLGILLVIGLCSLPVVRRKHFEIFQAAHLLVYPLIGLLVAHGTRAWLQAPMLGYWLALPVVVLLGERLLRIYYYSRPARVHVEVQQSDVVLLIVDRPRGWNVVAGQYVLVCIPEISLWQWHPFSISSFSDQEIRLHIRTTSGRWTSKVGTAAFDRVLIDGPFGAPAQRFRHYDRAVIIGTGIGITPYIGALSNRALSQDRAEIPATHDRITDLHWIARDATVFSWFAETLNTAAVNDSTIFIQTYMTSRFRSTSTYVFSVLADRNSQPHRPGVSTLTGLCNKTVFARPRLARILVAHEQTLPSEYRGNIGVFFCGPKYVGMELSDRCKGMSMHRPGVQWDFIGEVF